MGPPPGALSFDPGSRYKARAARDHLKEVLDAAEAGAVPVITRSTPVALLDVRVAEELLAEKAPFRVLSSVTDDQVAFWLEDGLVHAVGETLAGATDAFLDALIEYAEDWLSDLRDAPNHEHNRLLVVRIALHAGDRKALEAAVFGD